MANTKKTKALDATILLPVTEEAQSETAMESKIANITEAYSGDRDLINQLLGQTQAFQAVAKFTTVVSLSKLQIIKENKLYKDSKGLKTPDGQELSGTWADFVELGLGMSVNKIDEDLLNLNAFGEDALASLTSIGAGYRELRKLRKLPDDVKDQVIQGRLVDLTDKDDVVALIDELTSEQTRVVDKLNKHVTNLTEDAQAVDQLLGDKSDRITELEKEVHKLRNKSGEWSARAFDIAMETTTVGSQALEALDRLDQLRDAILNEDFGDQDREAALEHMAVVFYDIADHIFARANETMANTDQVFIGYKDRARPIMEAFATQPSTTTVN
ncbi:MAG TPA: hypothetical protein VK974_00790 [Methylophilaceae bacterium]|nr:hypothetical protein [Methylophilaceae bacterium]